jgi:uncharacterized repeat protein (TIGR02543 family)
MAAASSYAATLYVDATGGADTNGGLSREKAKKSIQAAIEASSDGDLILVNDGSYEPIDTDNKRIEIRSVNGPETTVIDGSLQWDRGVTNRCATLGSDQFKTNSVLSGFCLTNGITAMYGGGSFGGTLTNCVLSGNTVTYYGGGSVGGTLNNCVLSGNKAAAGGGSWNASLNNCVLSGNTAGNHGGGSYGGTLNNCVLSGNKANFNGGGAHGGSANDTSLNNCVLSGNTANYGGGAYGATLNNCVLSDNRAEYYGGGADEATLNNCIVWGNSAGWQHPAVRNSNCQYCCLDETVAGTGNIFEDPLFVAPANGDYRLKSGSPCIDAGWIPWREDLDTDLDGNPRWVGAQIDMGAYEYQQNSAPSPEPRPPTTWYVDAENGSDSQTGASPAEAKKTIQAAVSISRDGDCILVSPGTYGPVATMNLRIRIVSLEGAEATVIDGGGVTRCATLGTSTNSVLEGFRLQNGSADYGGGSYWGTLNNCVLSGNTAGKNGGGSYFGTLNNCVLRGNTATEAGGSGGGSYDGTLNNCLLTENTAEYGGGSYGGTLNNCTVGRNRVTRAGGGTYMSSLVNTIVWENSAPNAADVHNCTATYCCIPDQAQVQGAGNIRNDPLFADATNGNYRLRFDSPCINAGWTKHAIGDTDLAGNPRIAGGKVDIGAYEGGFIGDYVTLDQQGGSNGTARVFATRGTEMTAITVPMRMYYDFGGYYTAPYGGGTPYYTDSGASARTWDKTEATTLYAKWTAKTAMVLLDQQGGSKGTAHVLATCDAEMPAITVPTRTYYVFGGYYTAPDGGGTQYYTASGASARTWDKTEETTLYAKWTLKTATVSLDLTRTVWGGHAAGLARMWTNGVEVAGVVPGVSKKVVVVQGTKVVVSFVPDTGWTRKGADETCVFTASGDRSFAPVFLPNPAATLRWKYSSAVGRYFAQIAIPSRPGYAKALGGFAFIFSDRTKGGVLNAQLWNATARAPQGVLIRTGGVAYRGVALGAAPFGGLANGRRAIWGVTDATFGDARQIVPAGERSVGLYVRKRVRPAKGNEKAGEVPDFIGYLTWTTAGTRYYLPVLEGGAAGAVTTTPPVASQGAGASTSAGAFKVVFAANGGTGSMSAQTYTSGKAKKLRKNKFKRKGYVFIGWSTRKNGPVAYKNKQKVKNIGKAGKSVTLYAAWAKATYKVVFDASGGRGKMPVQKFTYGKAQKLASNKFTRKGYVFGGWAIRDPLATVPKVAYRNGQAVKNLSIDGRTVKLYAVWKRRR